MSILNPAGSRLRLRDECHFVRNWCLPKGIKHRCNERNPENLKEQAAEFPWSAQHEGFLCPSRSRTSAAGAQRGNPPPRGRGAVGCSQRPETPSRMPQVHHHECHRHWERGNGPGRRKVEAAESPSWGSGRRGCARRDGGVPNPLSLGLQVLKSRAESSI